MLENKRKITNEHYSIIKKYHSWKKVKTNMFFNIRELF